jgi:serine/threonine protein kinase
MVFVAQGSYGCVFSPNLPCTSQSITHSDTVGKIFASTNALEQEAELAQTVNKLDPKHVFTVPFYGKCRTSFEAVNSKELNRCRHITKIKKTRATSQLLFKQGGVELYQLLNDKTLQLHQLIPLFLSLFQGIATLLKHKLVHADIKPANILVDWATKKAYLIDFGLMSPIKEIPFKFWLLRYPYLYFPPEFMIYYLLKVNDKTIKVSNILNRVNNVHIDNINFRKDWLDKFMPNLNNELQTFIDMCVENPREFFRNFERRYLYKFDSYSIGMSILEIFARAQAQQVCFGNKDIVNKFLKTIVVPMVNFNPGMRMDIKEAIKLTKKLIKDSSFESGNQCSLPKVVPVPKNQTKKSSPTHKCNLLKRSEIVHMLKDVGKPTYGNKKLLCDRLDGKKCLARKKSLIVQDLKTKRLPIYGNKRELCARLECMQSKKNRNC